MKIKKTNNTILITFNKFDLSWDYIKHTKAYLKDSVEKDLKNMDTLCLDLKNIDHINTLGSEIIVYILKKCKEYKVNFTLKHESKNIKSTFICLGVYKIIDLISTELSSK